VTFELVGFILGLIGAIWMKISLSLLNREKAKPEPDGPYLREESPAQRAFLRGISLILIGGS
jgi:hypothetical protein